MKCYEIDRKTKLKKSFLTTLTLIYVSVGSKKD